MVRRLFLVVRLHGGDDRFELSCVYQAVQGRHRPGPATVLLGAGDDTFALDDEPGTEPRKADLVVARAAHQRVGQDRRPG